MVDREGEEQAEAARKKEMEEIKNNMEMEEEEWVIEKHQSREQRDKKRKKNQVHGRQGQENMEIVEAAAGTMNQKDVKKTFIPADRGL